jgi:hypothetical protein
MESLPFIPFVPFRDIGEFYRRRSYLSYKDKKLLFFQKNFP